MKKHILGLTLFSFIVGAAAIIYGIFNFSNISVDKAVKYETPMYIPAEKAHCKIKRNVAFNLIQVRQAVFDWQTKQFNWELETPNVDEPIDLLFFSKDNQGTRFIAAERIDSNTSSDGILRFSDSYDWQNKLNSFENLYVVAQFASESKNYSENYEVNSDKFQPKFSAARATAVTIDYGK